MAIFKCHWVNEHQKILSILDFAEKRRVWQKLLYTFFLEWPLEWYVIPLARKQLVNVIPFSWGVLLSRPPPGWSHFSEPVVSPHEGPSLSGPVRMSNMPSASAQAARFSLTNWSNVKTLGGKILQIRRGKTKKGGGGFWRPAKPWKAAQVWNCFIDKMIDGENAFVALKNWRQDLGHQSLVRVATHTH